MKKLFTALTISMLLLTPYGLYAQESQSETAHEGMQGMMGKGKKGMCPMCGMMMKSMMSSSLVSTEDGGVILLSGDKLRKFDKDLKVVKEADVPMDTAAMHGRMMEMMKNCPMCQKMMKEEGNS